MKLLLINKQNPSQTKYVSPKDIGVFLWGRRLSNYIVLLVQGNSASVIDFDTCDYSEIQRKIDSIFGK